MQESCASWKIAGQNCLQGTCDLGEKNDRVLGASCGRRIKISV